LSNYHYGGQAVMEGVMMRGERSLAIAVRQPDGAIRLHSEPLKGKLFTHPWMKLPFARGIGMLADTLVLGIRALMFSADVALGEEDVQFSGPIAWGTIAVSFIIAIGVFFVGPLLLVSLLDRYITSSVLSNLAEGVLRLALFLTYMWAVGYIPDIRRVFAYHGAEHKAVNALEAGAPLDAESVQRYPTAHTRCGTAFLLTVAVVSIILFTFLGRPFWLIRYLSRIVLIPVIAGIAYEWLKYGAAHYSNPIVRLFERPGLALQRLTTRPPDDAMVEVAIAALKEAIARDEKPEGVKDTVSETAVAANPAG
jgi:uncharacterized protein YqhQ